MDKIKFGFDMYYYYKYGEMGIMGTIVLIHCDPYINIDLYGGCDKTFSDIFESFETIYYV